MATNGITQTFAGTGTGTFSPAAATHFRFIRPGSANLTLFGGGGATIKLEKSYDAGTTYFDVSLDALGTVASYVLASNAEVSVVIDEPESDVYYRANCTAYTAGSPTSRIAAG